MARLNGYFFEPIRRWSIVCAGVMLLTLACNSAAQNRRKVTSVTIVGCVTTVKDPNVSAGQITITVLNTEHKTTTKADGCYEIRYVAPNLYRIEASNGGYYHPQTKPVRLYKYVQSVNFVLKPTKTPGNITGTALDFKGKPLAGAVVALYRPESANRIATKVTDSQGLWTYTKLAAPESYRVAIISKRPDGSEAVDFAEKIIRLMPNQDLAMDLNTVQLGSQLSVTAYIRDSISPGVRPETPVVGHSGGRSIMGTVTDPTGAAVPGVTVIASGEGRPPTSATSDENGSFHILNIEPGTYTVRVEAQKGFGAVEQIDVPVSFSAPAALAIQLKPEGAATATVEVTANSAGIDTTQNTTGTNVSDTQFSNFPSQRTVQELYSLSPGVTRSGLRDASGRDRDPSVAGSSGPENNYILDGVQISDPVSGGSGANLPFEFVQAVEIKTGAYGADMGGSTGGIFNVVTRTGSNDLHGDAFAYFTTRNLVREVKSSAIPFTQATWSSFSQIDAGGDIGGRIIKDKLFYYAAFNPQRRRNYFLTQTFLQEVTNEVTTPLFAGKLTWQPNQGHTLTFSTFSDYAKQQGHLLGFSDFGADLRSFRGETQSGGSNYTFRLNSTFTPKFTAEFLGGFHFQRLNILPELDETLIMDDFAVLRNRQVLSLVETTVIGSDGIRLAFVDGSGGSLQRSFVRSGFGLKSTQDRNLYVGGARFHAIVGRHTLKWGFEFAQNRYKLDTRSTGPNLNFNAAGVPPRPYTVENLFAVCQRDGSTIICPTDSRTVNVQALINAGQAPVGVTTALTGAVATNPSNPFLLLDVVRARDFSLSTGDEFLKTNTESFYFQGDSKLTSNLQFNLGVRGDYQQIVSPGSSDAELSLNNFFSNLQPRIGITWDFTGEGRGKIFANFARFIETPVPLEIAIRALGNRIQNDFNLNVSRLNGGPGSTTLINFGNLSNLAMPVDPDLKPHSVDEWTAGIEWSPSDMQNLALGFRGLYRALDEVIEDGSFDDGTTYFIFNPDGSRNGATAGFGPARRYYRALEFSATKRLSQNYQFITSYVYSSLIGNYEGLVRNDNHQPNRTISKLFDLVSLLEGHYGRLPNDRPHQFKFDGAYIWRSRLTLGASFRAQSGIPFNALIPHPLYGDDQGFCLAGVSCVPRGTAINPITGTNRTPTIYNLDVGISYSINLGEKPKLKFQLDWFNVLNNQRALRMDETFFINSGATGILPVPNPFHGAGTIFQFPSNLRLGVKFQF
jgi:hypothetical protein